MSSYLTCPYPTEEAVASMSVGNLKFVLKKYKCESVLSSIINKEDLVAAVEKKLKPLRERFYASTRYDLIANICHTGKEESGSYKCYVLHKALNQWFAIEDMEI